MHYAMRCTEGTEALLDKHTISISSVRGQLHAPAALQHKTAPCTNQTADWVGPKVSLNAVQKETLPLLRINPRFPGCPACRLVPTSPLRLVYFFLLWPW